VRRSLKDLSILNALLSMTAAMLANKQLHVEPHLHLLMPAVMTCIVGKQLCKSSLENHWALRDRASRLLTLICQRYSSPYSSLQQRVTATLMHAFLDAAKPLTTNYGAVVGLSALGAQTMKQLVVPNTSPMCAVLYEKIFAVKKLGSGKGVVLGMLQTADGKPVGKDGAKDDERTCLVVEAKGVQKEGHEVWQEKSAIKRLEAVRMRGALLDAVGTCVYLEAKARMGAAPSQQPLSAALAGASAGGGGGGAGGVASPASAVAAASGGGGDAYEQVCCVRFLFVCFFLPFVGNVYRTHTHADTQAHTY
jgi:hypothetical protein